MAGSPRGGPTADAKSLGDAQARLHPRRCGGARYGNGGKYASAADRAASDVASRSGDSLSLSGFRQHRRSCGDRPASRLACVLNADFAVQHGLCRCAPGGGGESRATRASAPDITSSIGPAPQDKRHQSLAPESEPRSAALGPDQIGALLRDKPVDGGSRLVRAAQIALAKLGYAVKSTGAEDGATRRALRHFERTHGLAPTTEISPEIVKQLMAAAGG